MESKENIIDGFLIIGGDERNLILNDLLLENGFISKIYKEDNEPFEIQHYKYIITGIPISKNGVDVYSKILNINLTVSELIANLENNQVLFSSQIDSKLIENCPFKYENILKNESFLIKNAISTSEGVIFLIMKHLSVDINDSKILITGYGRIGRNTARLLRSFTNDVYVVCKSDESRAKCKRDNINIISLERDFLGNFDIVVNTVPELIINSEIIERFSNNTMFIEVASKPYGIDKKYCEVNNKKYLLASGIPSWYSTTTSSNNIYDMIINSLRGVFNEK